MSRPIVEPTAARTDAQLGFGDDQLFRRPARQMAPANFVIKVFSDTQTLTVGNGAFIFAIPDDVNLYNLVDADGFVTTVSSSGLVTVQIRNITQGADMLSTRITIDVGEFTSYTAAAPPVIDTANDDVATGNLIAVDVDVAGTGAMGLGVILSFERT